MWHLGLDDTDGPSGGCTTWVLTEVLREVRDQGLALSLVGHPRLVRLNPNVPWKTRGNAALAATFARVRGRTYPIGSAGGRALSARRTLRPFHPRLRRSTGPVPGTMADGDALWAVVLGVLKRSSSWQDPGTDPTALLVSHRPSVEWYWRAVRELVEPTQVLSALSDLPGQVRLASFGDGRGVVGATAAVAWRGRRRSWEAIAYRARGRWGSRREVDADSVRQMAAREPSTFLSWDERTRRLLVAPHTPCPILFGIRSRDPACLPRALAQVQSEEVDRWVVFETNQTSGDHLVPRLAREAAPATAGVFQGWVRGRPSAIPGGHVAFEMEDGTGSLACLAFEPSKSLPAIVRELLPGDRVRVWGSVPYEARTPVLHLEGLQVLAPRPARAKGHNPLCPTCQRRSRSLGRNKGYRCDGCGARFPPESAEAEPRPRGRLRGTYLPTSSARRHLSPLGAPARHAAPNLTLYTKSTS